MLREVSLPVGKVVRIAPRPWTPGYCIRLTGVRNPRAAELLNAIPETPADDVDASAAQDRFISAAFARNPDPDEAALEAAELNRYLLAKSLFDCKEFDRCAAVFLPDSLLAGFVPTTPRPEEAPPAGAGKDPAAPAGDRSKPAAGPSATSAASAPQGGAHSRLPQLSQKSLFLALYAKLISGEKRKDEDAEMVMGPHDLGVIINKQLVPISSYLEQWFSQRRGEDDEIVGSQGWLEYLSVSLSVPRPFCIALLLTSACAVADMAWS